MGIIGGLLRGPLRGVRGIPSAREQIGLRAVSEVGYEALARVGKLEIPVHMPHFGEFGSEIGRKTEGGFAVFEHAESVGFEADVVVFGGAI